MARQKIVPPREVGTLTDQDAARMQNEMPVIRGNTNIKPPSKKAIEGMKRDQFKRKYPHTSA